jgi:hypothetical protein
MDTLCNSSQTVGLLPLQKGDPFTHFDESEKFGSCIADVVTRANSSRTPYKVHPRTLQGDQGIYLQTLASLCGFDLQPDDTSYLETHLPAKLLNFSQRFELEKQLKNERKRHAVVTLISPSEADVKMCIKAGFLSIQICFHVDPFETSRFDVLRDSCPNIHAAYQLAAASKQPAVCGHGGAQIIVHSMSFEEYCSSSHCTDLTVMVNVEGHFDQRIINKLACQVDMTLYSIVLVPKSVQILACLAHMYNFSDELDVELQCQRTASAAWLRNGKVYVALANYEAPTDLKEHDYAHPLNFYSQAIGGPYPVSGRAFYTVSVVSHVLGVCFLRKFRNAANPTPMTRSGVWIDTGFRMVVPSLAKHEPFAVQIAAASFIPEALMRYLERPVTDANGFQGDSQKIASTISNRIGAGTLVQSDLNRIDRRDRSRVTEMIICENGVFKRASKSVATAGDYSFFYRHFMGIKTKVARDFGDWGCPFFDTTAEAAERVGGFTSDPRKTGYGGVELKVFREVDIVKPPVKRTLSPALKRLFAWYKTGDLPLSMSHHDEVFGLHSSDLLSGNLAVANFIFESLEAYETLLHGGRDHVGIWKVQDINTAAIRELLSEDAAALGVEEQLFIDAFIPRSPFSRMIHRAGGWAPTSITESRRRLQHLLVTRLEEDFKLAAYQAEQRPDSVVHQVGNQLWPWRTSAENRLLTPPDGCSVGVFGNENTLSLAEITELGMKHDRPLVMNWICHSEGSHMTWNNLDRFPPMHRDSVKFVDLFVDDNHVVTYNEQITRQNYVGLRDADPRWANLAATYERTIFAPDGSVVRVGRFDHDDGGLKNLTNLLRVLDSFNLHIGECDAIFYNGCAPGKYLSILADEFELQIYCFDPDYSRMYMPKNERVHYVCGSLLPESLTACRHRRILVYHDEQTDNAGWSEKYDQIANFYDGFDFGNRAAVVVLKAMPGARCQWATFEQNFYSGYEKRFVKVFGNGLHAIQRRFPPLCVKHQGPGVSSACACSGCTALREHLPVVFDLGNWRLPEEDKAITDVVLDEHPGFVCDGSFFSRLTLLAHKEYVNKPGHYAIHGWDRYPYSYLTVVVDLPPLPVVPEPLAPVLDGHDPAVAPAPEQPPVEPAGALPHPAQPAIAPPAPPAQLPIEQPPQPQPILPAVAVPPPAPLQNQIVPQQAPPAPPADDVITVDFNAPVVAAAPQQLENVIPANNPPVVIDPVAFIKKYNQDNDIDVLSHADAKFRRVRLPNNFTWSELTRVKELERLDLVRKAEKPNMSMEERLTIHNKLAFKSKVAQFSKENETKFRNLPQAESDWYIVGGGAGCSKTTALVALAAALQQSQLTFGVLTVPSTVERFAKVMGPERVLTGEKFIMADMQYDILLIDELFGHDSYTIFLAGSRAKRIVGSGDSTQMTGYHDNVADNMRLEALRNYLYQCMGEYSITTNRLNGDVFALTNILLKDNLRIDGGFAKRFNLQAGGLQLKRKEIPGEIMSKASIKVGPINYDAICNKKDWRTITFQKDQFYTDASGARRPIDTIFKAQGDTITNLNVIIDHICTSQADLNKDLYYSSLYVAISRVAAGGSLQLYCNETTWEILQRSQGNFARYLQNLGGAPVAPAPTQAPKRNNNGRTKPAAPAAAAAAPQNQAQTNHQANGKKKKMKGPGDVAAALRFEGVAMTPDQRPTMTYSTAASGGRFIATVQDGKNKMNAVLNNPMSGGVTGVHAEEARAKRSYAPVIPHVGDFAEHLNRMTDSYTSLGITTSSEQHVSPVDWHHECVKAFRDSRGELMRARLKINWQKLEQTRNSAKYKAFASSSAAVKQADANAYFGIYSSTARQIKHNNLDLSEQLLKGIARQFAGQIRNTKGVAERAAALANMSVRLNLMQKEIVESDLTKAFKVNGPDMQAGLDRIMVKIGDMVGIMDEINTLFDTTRKKIDPESVTCATKSGAVIIMKNQMKVQESFEKMKTFHELVKGGQPVSNLDANINYQEEYQMITSRICFTLLQLILVDYWVFGAVGGSSTDSEIERFMDMTPGNGWFLSDITAQDSTQNKLDIFIFEELCTSFGFGELARAVMHIMAPMMRECRFRVMTPGISFNGVDNLLSGAYLTLAFNSFSAWAIIAVMSMTKGPLEALDWVYPLPKILTTGDDGAFRVTHRLDVAAEISRMARWRELKLKFSKVGEFCHQIFYNDNQRKIIGPNVFRLAMKIYTTPFDPARTLEHIGEYQTSMCANALPLFDPVHAPTLLAGACRVSGYTNGQAFAEQCLDFIAAFVREKPERLLASVSPIAHHFNLL